MEKWPYSLGVGKKKQHSDNKDPPGKRCSFDIVVSKILLIGVVQQILSTIEVCPQGSNYELQKIKSKRIF